MSSTLKTPVVFIVFNRPDTTAKVFEEIRKARPEKLFVIADGPRIARVDEITRCKEVRNIVDCVDWECQVITNFSDVNLGCKLRIVSGLDWVFNQVDEAIILEDDCLPDQSFFKYCEELLGKYSKNENVMMIAGTNKVSFEKNRQSDTSYYFTSLPNIWGWATWKRAWGKYDIEMQSWGTIKAKKSLFKIIDNKWTSLYLTSAFDQTYRGEIDTWDFEWFCSIIQNEGICIAPSVNLISNIGFGNGATNTKEGSRLSNLQKNSMQFPLKHPQQIIIDKAKDNLEAQEIRRALKFHWLPFFLYAMLKKIYKKLVYKL